VISQLEIRNVCGILNLPICIVQKSSPLRSDTVKGSETSLKFRWEVLSWRWRL